MEIVEGIKFYSLYSIFIEHIVNEDDVEYSIIFDTFKDFTGTQDIDCKLMFFNGKFNFIYMMNDINSFFIFEVYQILEKEILIKRCANCGRYFIPINRSDAIYCDRASPKDKSMTCKEYGSQKLWYDKLKENKTMKLYRNIYMAKQMLAKRNPDIKEYQQDFEQYKIESKEWKKDIKDGTKTEDEFVTWLKAVRGKKYLD